MNIIYIFSAVVAVEGVNFVKNSDYDVTKGFFTAVIFKTRFLDVCEAFLKTFLYTEKPQTFKVNILENI